MKKAFPFHHAHGMRRGRLFDLDPGRFLRLRRERRDLLEFPVDQNDRFLACDEGKILSDRDHAGRIGRGGAQRIWQLELLCHDQRVVQRSELRVSILITDENLIVPDRSFRLAVFERICGTAVQLIDTQLLFPVFLHSVKQVDCKMKLGRNI